MLTGLIGLLLRAAVIENTFFFHLTIPLKAVSVQMSFCLFVKKV